MIIECIIAHIYDFVYIRFNFFNIKNVSLPYFPVVYYTIMINFIENILSRFESPSLRFNTMIF